MTRAAHLQPRIRLSLAIVLVAIMAPVIPVTADGFIYVEKHHHIIRPPRPTPVPRPRRIPRPQFPLRVTRHHVSIEIDNALARTTVDETFYQGYYTEVLGNSLPFAQGSFYNQIYFDKNGSLPTGPLPGDPDNPTLTEFVAEDPARRRDE